jgi:hypothetical protein
MFLNLLIFINIYKTLLIICLLRNKNIKITKIAKIIIKFRTTNDTVM